MKSEMQPNDLAEIMERETDEKAKDQWWDFYHRQERERVEEQERRLRTRNDGRWIGGNLFKR